MPAARKAARERKNQERSIRIKEKSTKAIEKPDDRRKGFRTKHNGANAESMKTVLFKAAGQN